MWQVPTPSFSLVVNSYSAISTQFKCHLLQSILGPPFPTGFPDITQFTSLSLGFPH